MRLLSGSVSVAGSGARPTLGCGTASRLDKLVRPAASRSASRCVVTVSGGASGCVPLSRPVVCLGVRPEVRPEFSTGLSTGFSTAPNGLRMARSLRICTAARINVDRYWWPASRMACSILRAEVPSGMPSSSMRLTSCCVPSGVGAAWGDGDGDGAVVGFGVGDGDVVGCPCDA